MAEGSQSHQRRESILVVLGLPSGTTAVELKSLVAPRENVVSTAWVGGNADGPSTGYVRFTSETAAAQAFHLCPRQIRQNRLEVILTDAGKLRRAVEIFSGHVPAASQNLNPEHMVVKPTYSSSYIAC
eukprot:TRINITY_DN2826_c0_g1_i1.p1 TRINITY_DN2826_c0_g1~~TRINITY_DN2826_c0_g1_i1.p1  ORF type:complete len:145 (+),score=33.49 TRINITY_DN2826_c0_g1_i1:53-436(+)